MSVPFAELIEQFAQVSLVLGKWIPATVLAAGLTGSLHCTAMCGPLVVAATLPSERDSAGRPRRSGALIAFYQLGRLAGYVSLGAVAGALGAGVFAGVTGTTLSWVSTFVIAAAFGVLAWKAWRGEPPHLLPASLSASPLRKILGAKSLPPSARAASVGALSALLPCGWLHSFVLAAATTRSAAAGAVLMAVFWTGTLPALSIAPLVIRKLLDPLRRVAPRASAVLLLLAALASIGLQWAPLALARSQIAAGAAQGEPVTGEASCHPGGAGAGDS